MRRQNKACTLILLGLIFLRIGSRLTMCYRVNDSSPGLSNAGGLRSLPHSHWIVLDEDGDADDSDEAGTMIRPIRRGIHCDLDTTPQPNLFDTFLWRPVESAHALFGPTLSFQSRPPDPLIHPPV